MFFNKEEKTYICLDENNNISLTKDKYASNIFYIAENEEEAARVEEALRRVENRIRANDFVKSVNERQQWETHACCHCCDAEDGDEETNETYVVTGSYPNLSIDVKDIVATDSYNNCVKEKETNNISLVSKGVCFNSYHEAMNYVLFCIQRATNKECSCLAEKTKKGK